MPSMSAAQKPVLSLVSICVYVNIRKTGRLYTKLMTVVSSEEYERKMDLELVSTTDVKFIRLFFIKKKQKRLEGSIPKC